MGYTKVAKSERNVINVDHTEVVDESFGNPSTMNALNVEKLPNQEFLDIPLAKHHSLFEDTSGGQTMKSVVWILKILTVIKPLFKAYVDFLHHCREIGRDFVMKKIEKCSIKNDWYKLPFRFHDTSG